MKENSLNISSRLSHVRAFSRSIVNYESFCYRLTLRFLSEVGRSDTGTRSTSSWYTRGCANRSVA